MFSSPDKRLKKKIWGIHEIWNSVMVGLLSWLGLACIALFLIFTVHNYVSANFK